MSAAGVTSNYKGQVFVASSIDEYFLDIISKRFLDIIGSFQEGIPDKFRPEFTCLVELLYYVLSVNNNATPAMKLFGLKFTKSLSLFSSLSSDNKQSTTIAAATPNGSPPKYHHHHHHHLLI